MQLLSAIGYVRGKMLTVRAKKLSLVQTDEFLSYYQILNTLNYQWTMGEIVSSVVQSAL